jgi:Zn-dependent protease with chaperone function
MAGFGITAGLPGGLSRLLMSHPPLAERIAVLERAASRRWELSRGQ